jgi:uncharacterized membrane protein
MELWRLFAHSHWFTLSLIGKKIRICARCTGYVAGFTFLYILQQILKLDFLRITPTWTFYLSLVLLVPLIFDWLTQSWGLRESVNGIRFITGLLFGFALFFFLNSSILHARNVIVISAFFIAAVGLLGKINRSKCC